MQSCSQIITTNKPVIFYKSDALPVAQATASKHWRENITFHGLAFSCLILQSVKALKGKIVTFVWVIELLLWIPDMVAIGRCGLLSIGNDVREKSCGAPTRRRAIVSHSIPDAGWCRLSPEVWRCSFVYHMW